MRDTKDFAGLKSILDGTSRYGEEKLRELKTMENDGRYLDVERWEGVRKSERGVTVGLMDQGRD